MAWRYLHAPPYTSYHDLLAPLDGSLIHRISGRYLKVSVRYSDIGLGDFTLDIVLK